MLSKEEILSKRLVYGLGVAVLVACIVALFATNTVVMIGDATITLVGSHSHFQRVLLMTMTLTSGYFTIVEFPIVLKKAKSYEDVYSPDLAESLGKYSLAFIIVGIITALTLILSLGTLLSTVVAVVIANLLAYTLIIKKLFNKR